MFKLAITQKHAENNMLLHRWYEKIQFLWKRVPGSTMDNECG